MSQSAGELSFETDELASLDPAKLCDKIARAGREWADADAGASVLEETRKSVLAKLTLKYMTAGRVEGGKSVTKAEADTRAMADAEYETHLGLAVEARKLANRLRVQYDVGKMYIELMRSVHATRRAEMNLR